MKHRRVGVVILTYNSEKHIQKCLDSILKNHYPNFKIILVDNASEDNTVSFIQKHYPQIRLFKNHINWGFARGCNKGIRYFLKDKDCQYIMLLNDDTVVAQNLISELLKPFSQDSKIGMTGPIITYLKDSSKIWFAGGYFNKIFCYTRHHLLDKDLSKCFITDQITDFISGCCMMVKIEVFEKIGLFDESYENYFEDVAFCHKARSCGFLSFIVSKPLVGHRVSASFGVEGSNRLSTRRAYYYARNPFIFIKKETKGLLKLTNIIGQFLIRFPYYMLQMLKQKAFDSINSYFRGLLSGLNYLID